MTETTSDEGLPQAGIPPSRRPKGGSPVFPCPSCGAYGKQVNVKFISHTLRTLYYRCDDIIDCGHVWTANLEYEASITPSRKGPVKKTAPFLRLKPAT